MVAIFLGINVLTFLLLEQDGKDAANEKNFSDIFVMWLIQGHFVEGKRPCVFRIRIQYIIFLCVYLIMIIRIICIMAWH